MATLLNSPKNSSAERGQLVVAHAGSKSTSTTFEPCAPLITDAGAVIRIPGEGLGLDSCAVAKRVGWCAMSRGGRPWRELLVI